MIIGYGVGITVFRRRVYTKYYLNGDETERGTCPLWKYERIPFVNVIAYCVRDIDIYDYPEEVMAIKNLTNQSKKMN